MEITPGMIYRQKLLCDSGHFLIHYVGVSYVASPNGYTIVTLQIVGGAPRALDQTSIISVYGNFNNQHIYLKWDVMRPREVELVEFSHRYELVVDNEYEMAYLPSSLEDTMLYRLTNDFTSASIVRTGDRQFKVMQNYIDLDGVSAEDWEVKLPEKHGVVYERPVEGWR